ncbi:MAG: polyprenyl synthetase family protein [Promethearchaeota archaeon]
MNFKEYIKHYSPKVNDAISSIYDNRVNNVQNEFLKSYYKELKEYFLVGGCNRIRPLLGIAAYNAFSEDKDDRIILPSVGLEFFHIATLIHNDIIDNAKMRGSNHAFHYRFKQYHKKYNLKIMETEDFGNNVGILGGDSAFFFGVEAYLSSEFEFELNVDAIRYYEEVFKEICDSVLIEVELLTHNHLKIEDYIEMISLKTGALIEKSLLIGANYAKADDKYYQYLSSYGINLGIISQIIDDILGTFGDEKEIGKSTDRDIREGKKTCLLIEAYNNLEGKKKNRLNELIEKENMTQNEVQEVKDLFIEADVVSSCKKLIDSYFQEAKLSLNKLKSVINESEFEFLNDLLNFVANRRF